MKWISVKDRLLGKDCVVLVAAGRHVTIADWYQADGWSLRREDRAIGITSDSIAYWMPLPEPPKDSGGNADSLSFLFFAASAFCLFYLW